MSETGQLNQDVGLQQYLPIFYSHQEYFVVASV